ncbi:hypothetical protein C4K14_1911 [Pseudomonas chlororaphis subsp. aureofaciens]|uniref:hypothetical protein n=1 Tax=Pseudomonas chlororaphis TaxID=587753 RepID=UPI000F6F50FA|nr:hypothetical protein [Pseudomonas chlororaphis]AZD84745.1 hypothetical protein C4K14_1911 [Pseudomonas chlororaphis subsp. aureofaciens]
MLENSSVPENEVPKVVEPFMLNERELILLARFRLISYQQQKDVLRLLEAFVQLQE